MDYLDSSYQLCMLKMRINSRKNKLWCCKRFYLLFYSRTISIQYHGVSVIQHNINTVIFTEPSCGAPSEICSFVELTRGLVTKNLFLFSEKNHKKLYTWNLSLSRQEFFIQQVAFSQKRRSIYLCTFWTNELFLINYTSVTKRLFLI